MIHEKLFFNAFLRTTMKGYLKFSIATFISFNAVSINSLNIFKDHHAIYWRINSNSDYWNILDIYSNAVFRLFEYKPALSLPIRIQLSIWFPIS